MNAFIFIAVGAVIGSSITFTMTQCNQEDELTKIIKEEKRINRITSGAGREIPRVIIKPDGPTNKKGGA